MLVESDKSRFVHKARAKLSTIILLLIIDALVYYVPFRNEVYIGDLFGLSLWLYFGILNGILITLVYVIVKGEVVFDFSSKQISFNEFKKSNSWEFEDLWGIYFLAYDDDYLIRIRTHRLRTLDVRMKFEEAYQIVEQFKKIGYPLKTIRPDPPKRLSKSFPLLLSKYEKKQIKEFNPEIPDWYRGITLKTKLISITIAPFLYILGATLIVRIPSLLAGLTKTKGIVSFIYGLTVFILFDGGLYLLFGLSVFVLIAKQISRFSSHPKSKKNPDITKKEQS
ncbi:MAG: hypothetical protein ACTSQF_04045 [Candidatus Heimdallarchaeaceae archaeon]